MPPWSPSSDSNFYDDPSPLPPPKSEASIPDVATFDRLAASEAAPIACHVVKWIIMPNGKLHFMDTKESPFHYHFAKRIDDSWAQRDTTPIETFNATVYTGEDRTLVCGSIVRYKIENAYFYAFEMVPTDPLLKDTSRPVREAFNQIQRGFDIGTLHFRATSHDQLENVAKNDNPMHGLPQLSTAKIWDSLIYLPVVRGDVFGFVKMIEDSTNEDEMDSITSSDIVVFTNGIPNELPPAIAIILTDPLPPLCHISLLCRNRRLPCAYVAKSELGRFKTLIGKQCNIRISASDWAIAVSYGSRIRRNEFHLTELVAPRRAPKAPFVLTTLGPNVVVATIGAKAYQFVKLDMLLNQPSTCKTSFVIPTGNYMDHVLAPTISSKISRVCSVMITNNPTKGPPQKLVKAELAKVRQAIMEKPVDSHLMSEVIELIKKLGLKRIILRSSTNAEDLHGFNAAGLYESVSLVVDPLVPIELENAIRTVWASIWSARAVMERHIFGIPLDKVAMCILAQPHFSDEMLLCNGVAVTVNPFERAKYGVYVTAFPGGAHRATDSISSAVINPEQTIIHMSRVAGLYEPQLIAPVRGPGINTAESVLPPGFEILLGEQCSKLHSEFLRVSMAQTAQQSGWITCLDIEFLILKPEFSHTGKPELIIIQARPAEIQVEY